MDYRSGSVIQVWYQFCLWQTSRVISIYDGCVPYTMPRFWCLGQFVLLVLISLELTLMILVRILVHDLAVTII